MLCPIYGWKASRLTRRATRPGDADTTAGCGCTATDDISWTISRLFQLYATPHAPCYLLYLVPIGHAHRCLQSTLQIVPDRFHGLCMSHPCTFRPDTHHIIAYGGGGGSGTRAQPNCGVRGGGGGAGPAPNPYQNPQNWGSSTCKYSTSTVATKRLMRPTRSPTCPSRVLISMRPTYAIPASHSLVRGVFHRGFSLLSQSLAAAIRHTTSKDYSTSTLTLH